MIFPPERPLRPAACGPHIVNINLKFMRAKFQNHVQFGSLATCRSTVTQVRPADGSCKGNGSDNDDDADGCSAIRVWFILEAGQFRTRELD